MLLFFRSIARNRERIMNDESFTFLAVAPPHDTVTTSRTLIVLTKQAF
jgi:hypothetical protein